MKKFIYFSSLMLSVIHLQAQQVHLNLSYLPGDSIDSLRMVNLVLSQQQEPFPLLLWIGGGAWSYVDRHQELDLAQQFAQKGIGVAVIGHRLSNPIWQDATLPIGHQHPTHVRDVAQALHWLVEQAHNYGFDPDKVFVGGFSSGAHLSALLCSNEKYLDEVGLNQETIRGLIPVSGTYDISDYHAVFANGNNPTMAKTHVEAIFGEGEFFEDASPVHFIDHLTTPMLLISDNALYNYTKLYEEKLREANYQAFEVLYVQQLGHAQLWRDMSHNTASIYLAHMANFIWRESRS